MASTAMIPAMGRMGTPRIAPGVRNGRGSCGGAPAQDDHRRVHGEEHDVNGEVGHAGDEGQIAEQREPDSADRGDDDGDDRHPVRCDSVATRRGSAPVSAMPYISRDAAVSASNDVLVVVMRATTATAALGPPAEHVGHHVRQRPARPGQCARRPRPHRGDGDRHVQRGRDGEGGEQGAGDDPGGFTGLLGERDHLVEADEGEEHQRRTAHHATHVRAGDEAH